MKIALIVPGFSAHERDWCIPALLDYARALASRIETHVFTLRWPERDGEYTVHGARVRAMNGREHMGLRGIALWARTLEAVARDHRRRPFDVLHAFWADEPGWVAAWIGQLLKIPVMISLAGGELIGLREIGYGAQLLPGRSVFIRWSLRRAAAVTAGSQYMLNIARRHLPQTHWAKLARAPLGVDTTLFRPRPSRSPRPRRSALINVGSLTPVKDQAALLRALAQLDEVSLQIVGVGPLENDLRRLAAHLGVEGRLKFSGAIDHGKLPAVYRAAGVFVQSSRHEAQGMAALEAAACGLPVIGTAVGALPEIGSAAAVGDEEGLVQLIRRALREDGIEARGLPDEFHLPQAAQKFVSLYEAVAA